MTDIKDKVLFVRVDPALHGEAASQAAAMNESVAELARRAMRLYLDNPHLRTDDEDDKEVLAQTA
ncbi:hypothetical protein [Haloactinomyces albus]|uniref:Uncharacterized protein n=1 Tax=Haloactinomyces albus TaxID=1352928 RepID=A0AAE4CP81_9ACTN|nr:hypothetical protein [Haloactinomyces albus]MDR7304614.1 hypothetical protein [Haloactinomyces albus]